MFNFILTLVNNITHTTQISFKLFTLDIILPNELIAFILTAVFTALIYIILFNIFTILPKTLNKTFKKENKNK